MYIYIYISMYVKKTNNINILYVYYQVLLNMARSKNRSFKFH